MIDSSVVPTDLSRSIQVIGVGLPRTGTMSLCLALQNLLNGPVCHAGSACVLREEEFIKKWISILYPQPQTSNGFWTTLARHAFLVYLKWRIQDKISDTKREGAEDARVKATLRDLLAGYVATADAPSLFFAGELAEIYPDAKIICTIRDPDKWWVSYRELVETIDGWGQNLMNMVMPSLRYQLSWKLGIVERRKAIYPPGFEVTGPEFMKVHEDYLRSVVPAERLYFFNVKDGWEPLCEILGCPVPEEPFPRSNDKAEMKEGWDETYRFGANLVLGIILAPFKKCAKFLG